MQGALDLYDMASGGGPSNVPSNNSEPADMQGAMDLYDMASGGGPSNVPKPRPVTVFGKSSSCRH